MEPSPPSPTPASPVEDVIPVGFPPWTTISGGVRLSVMMRAHVRLGRLVPAPTAPPRLIVSFCRRTIPSREHPGESTDFAIYRPFHLLIQEQAWGREARAMLAHVAADYVLRADRDLLAEAFCQYTSSAVRRLPMARAVLMEIYSVIFVPVRSLGVSRLQAWLQPPEEFALFFQREGRNNAHSDRGPRPASAAAVEGLKMVTAAESDSCSICLEDFGKMALLAMPCNHLFHATCLKKWLERSCSCPLCRFSLPGE